MTIDEALALALESAQYLDRVPSTRPNAEAIRQLIAIVTRDHKETHGARS